MQEAKEASLGSRMRCDRSRSRDNESSGERCSLGWCSRRHGWGFARGEDGSGGSTGGGGAVRTGRGGAKRRAEAMVRAEVKAKAKTLAKAKKEGVQETVALALWSWSSDRNTHSTNLRVHGAARAESPPVEQY